MIFPIGDDQVQGGHKPIISYTFIGINILVFLLQLSAPDALICSMGSIPNEIVRGQDWFTLITSTFMHGGWMHLIGNMLFLWVFADNIEAIVGSIPFLAFYILGGIAASALHIGLSYGADLSNCCEMCAACASQGQDVNICPGSVPSVGASGAISAVMGAYLVMFPKSKIKILVVYFFKSFYVAAILFLGLWIGQQLISGFMSIGPEMAATGGTAWWAHIGGFIFGVAAGFVIKKSYDTENRLVSSNQRFQQRKRPRF